MYHSEEILIIDFGSQYTQLIARRVRESNVFSEIVPHTIQLSEIVSRRPKGIILSGGPMSVYDIDAPTIDEEIFNLEIPILGICYGLQLICTKLGGKVESATDREYGKAILEIDGASKLLANLPQTSSVWMSHGDLVTKVPDDFEIIGSSAHTTFCALENINRNIFGVQFHPEVNHTEFGITIIKNFVYNICGCSGDWTSSNFISSSIEEIKGRVGDKKVICALSGGVDSTVAAVLVNKAIGDSLYCIHIDNGLMRKNESEKIIKMFGESLHLNVQFVDASKLFLQRLEGISDPETKRKIIGKTFIDVFEEEARKIESAEFLVQGTLYPDVIESVSVKGNSVTIKTHHNVGGLPEKMKLKLIEPFRELFKDEVRNVGRELLIPEDLVARHPFPGPGLAVRVLGEITEERLSILKEADEIFINEIRKADLYSQIWQAFAVLLPVQTVGVMGDSRTYENVLALRAVTSTDGMTADWFRFDFDFLAKVSNLIINKVKGINRVVYDISSKPPSTIEWE
ncbi:MAG: glutamine-hydrolyzing GMP synthase [Ignavibacteriaceae bacterium]|nr:glutamine-hydrolyzing GMP synthase [Ignavibacteriaceae bacterium]